MLTNKQRFYAIFKALYFGILPYWFYEKECHYAKNGERDKQLEQQKLDQQRKLQERIDNGEMLNVGSDSKQHWVSKQVWDIVMKVSEKYYPNTKKE